MLTGVSRVNGCRLTPGPLLAAIVAKVFFGMQTEILGAADAFTRGDTRGLDRFILSGPYVGVIQATSR